VKLPKIRKDIQKHSEIIASLRRRDLEATRVLLGEHLQPAIWTQQGA
jgi:DNA-binding GntR family transcriptional regulator